MRRGECCVGILIEVTSTAVVWPCDEDLVRAIRGLEWRIGEAVVGQS